MHRTHFRERASRSSYQPSSNTPLLAELEQLAINQMVMDRSAVVAEEEPKLVQIAPAEKPCESETA